MKLSWRFNLLVFGIALVSFGSLAQTLDIHDSVRSYNGLTNITVTMWGRAELRLTGSGDAIPGSVIHLNSPDAWVLFTAIRPADVTDVSCHVDWADNIDALTWSGVGVTQQIISDDGARRTVRATIPKGTTGRRFVRLGISLIDL